MRSASGSPRPRRSTSHEDRYLPLQSPQAVRGREVGPRPPRPRGEGPGAGLRGLPRRDPGQGGGSSRGGLGGAGRIERQARQPLDEQQLQPGRSRQVQGPGGPGQDVAGGGGKGEGAGLPHLRRAHPPRASRRRVRRSRRQAEDPRRPRASRERGPPARRRAGAGEPRRTAVLRRGAGRRHPPDQLAVPAGDDRRGQLHAVRAGGARRHGHRRPLLRVHSLQGLPQVARCDDPPRVQAGGVRDRRGRGGSEGLRSGAAEGGLRRRDRH